MQTYDNSISTLKYCCFYLKDLHTSSTTAQTKTISDCTGLESREKLNKIQYFWRLDRKVELPFPLCLCRTLNIPSTNVLFYLEHVNAVVLAKF